MKERLFCLAACASAGAAGLVWSSAESDISIIHFTQRPRTAAARSEQGGRPVRELIRHTQVGEHQLNRETYVLLLRASMGRPWCGAGEQSRKTAKHQCCSALLEKIMVSERSRENVRTRG